MSSAMISLPIEVRITVDVDVPAEEFGVSIFIHDVEGKLIVHSSSMMNRKLRVLARGKSILTVTLPAYLLNSSTYIVSIAADVPNRRVIFHEEKLISFKVSMDCEEMGRYSTGAWKGLTGPGIADWNYYGSD